MDEDSHTDPSDVQAATSNFGFRVFLLSAFSQLRTFLLAVVTKQYRKRNVLRLHFGDSKFPSRITVTLMYAVAASPLAKQRE